MDRIGSILVTATTALGDSITFTPALTALRDRFSKARIVGLYHQAFSPLYENDPRFDRVIPYYGKYKRLPETLKALKEERCELALLPYMNDPDIIPMVLMGGTRTIFRMPGRNTIYSFLVANPELLSPTPPPGHSNRRGMDMVRHLGCDSQTLESRLYVTQSSQDSIRHFLMKTIPHFHPGQTTLIGFHPGASVPQKRWPVEQYADVGRRLLQLHPDARILITGTRSERGMCDEIRRGVSSDQVLNLAGSVRIETMPVLLKCLSVLLSGDTGIAVMAYAVECPTVTLFWRTDPTVCGPLHIGNRNHVIHESNIEAIDAKRVANVAHLHIQGHSGDTHVRNLR